MTDKFHDWQTKILAPALAKNPERQAQFTTASGEPVERLYTPADLKDWEAERDLGYPGAFPFTRGVQPTMYRGRL